MGYVKNWGDGIIIIQCFRDPYFNDFTLHTCLPFNIFKYLEQLISHKLIAAFKKKLGSDTENNGTYCNDES